MKEVLITSSVLIAALLLLRLVFRRAIPRRAQYALWALVLVRLLVPISLPAAPFSVLSSAPRVQTSVSAGMARPVYVLPVGIAPASDYPGAERTAPGGTVPAAQSFGYPVLSGDGQTVTTYAQKLSVGEVLTRIWLVGAALIGGFFLLTNLLFWRKLRKGRTPFPVEGCTRPVYLCAALPSPCLFGLLRPAIYLTPGAAAPENLRHVLAHEETHARHLDPIWSLARSLCLALYWFDPFVWAAAWASKADCELACDESALLRLGEGERIPYGETLLSLIPLRRGPSNPLLAATTMTSGKRQLKDRIARIAVRRRTVALALVAALVLALAVGACTFTGAKPSEQADTDRPLTGAELKYFNEEYFNGPDTSGSVYINPHNYFISSLYEKPEDINLYELFYLSIPNSEGKFDSPSDEECVLAFGQPWDDMPCAGYKLTPADMDAFLKQYTGLTLEETNKVGLDNFTYLPQYDAYYWAHGDTNYQRVRTLTGEREGDLIRLYYDASYTSFADTGYACLTMKEVDGGYHFVSNQVCEKPAIPTPLPDRDPVLTISLDTLAPYAAPALTVERHTDDCAERFGGYSVGEGGKHSVRTYRSTDGNVYAAVMYNEAAGRDGMLEWDAGVFMTLPDDESVSHLDGFSALFGHEGIVLSYPGPRAGGGDTTFNDYIYFTDDGTPTLLARVYGEAQILDLNGDGVDELVGDDQIFYQRDGKVYVADLPALLQAAWPESLWSYSSWDIYNRCLTIRGSVETPGWDNGDPFFRRYLYFDSKSLLLYKDGETVDNVSHGVTAPAEVLAAAKAMSQADYERVRTAEESAEWNRRFDDWRVSGIERQNLTSWGVNDPPADIEVYRYHCEFHSATPSDNLVAGGAYVDEDGWYNSSFSERPFLVFRVKDGVRVRLEDAFPVRHDNPDYTSLEFQRAFLQTLILNNLLSPDAPNVLAADYAQSVLSAAAASGSVALTLSPGDGGPGARYTVASDAGNGRNRVINFDIAFQWAFTPVDQPETPPDSRSNLLVESPDGSASVQCWEDFPAVLFTLNGEQRWLSAPLERDQGPFSNTIFDYLRLWYDEAEYYALSASLVVPDRGQSHLEIAQAMADLINAAELKVNGDSMFACSYVRNVADVIEDLPDSYFPAAAEGAERFGFSFAHIFVPRSEASYYGHMPGNTGEYGGEYGEAPVGAMSEGLMGAIYLTDEGWRCDGVGTG